MMTERKWDGKTVAVSYRDTHPRFPAGVVDIQFSEDSARKLALALKRLQQTNLMLPVEVQELADALDYTLVADPVSVAKHKRMEAGKGMTPDGGYRRPTGPRYN